MSNAHDHHQALHWKEWHADEQFGHASLGKIGMWVFLLSDCLSFAGLLLGYGMLRGGATTWHCSEALYNEGVCNVGPQGFEPAFGIPFTAGLTFLLICSSVTMVMSYAACVEGNRKGILLWLGLTIVAGALFLVGQYIEYFGMGHHGNLIGEGLVFGESSRASTFYVTTSFHGCHVFSGVTYLSIMWIQAFRGKFDNGEYNGLEIAGLFWHFVDLVWILVFTFIYLIPEPPGV
jgi:heme/copper-type cytochrome/quinol oxidase subunit 3